MKILKNIGIGLGVFLLIIAIVPALLPDKYMVERSIEIDKPVDLVFLAVADFNSYKKWNPWTQMEPTSKQTIEGEAATVGSKWSWDGKKVGKGSLTILALEPGKSIKSSLVFLVPMQSQASDTWKFEATPTGSTKVIWHNEGGFGYMDRYFGLMLDGMLGGQFETGLKNLKSLAETGKAY
ncbi:MAG: SRPBCC family protein [Cytophagales bacterium]